MLLFVLGATSLQAQVTGTPFIWKKRSSIPTCNAVNDKAITIDTDGDGIVDRCDADSDNDGIPDTIENLNHDVFFENDDVDGDILVTPVLGDGVSCYLDLDSDNDGILDLFESGIPITVINAIDANHDGIIDVGIAVGNNGFADVLETFPDSGIPKYALANTDCDDKPDFLDLTSNGTDYDLYAIGKDNLDQLGAGFITPIVDADKDGIMAAIDANDNVRGSTPSANSPYPNTTGQSLDANNDGVLDNCPQCNAVNDKSLTIDTDGDGIVDRCDADSDNDGIPDVIEDFEHNGQFQDDDVDGVFGPVAVLGDGVSSYLDLDSDNDGVLDLFESGIPIAVINAIDTNHDGIIDAGVALGNNGFADVLETFPDSGIPKYALANTDCDDKPDFLDLTSNGTDYDLYAIGKDNLDQLGAGFITPIVDADKDGIMAAIDADDTVRGSTPSADSPYPNTTDQSLDANNDGVLDNCAPVADMAIDPNPANSIIAMPPIPTLTCANTGQTWEDYFAVKIKNVGLTSTNASAPISFILNNGNSMDGGITHFFKFDFDNTVSTITSTSTGQTYAVDNPNWILTAGPTSGSLKLTYIGTPVAPNAEMIIGFKIYLDATAPNPDCFGSSQSSFRMQIEITNGSGGEINFMNNHYNNPVGGGSN